MAAHTKRKMAAHTKHKMAAHTRSDTSFKQYKYTRNRRWERLEKLKSILKSAGYKSLGKINRRNRRKHLKIWEDQIKQLTEAKKTSYKKWLASRKLEGKIEYERNTELARREVRRRHRTYWDKFVSYLEHKTYWTQPKVYTNFRTNTQGYKGNSENSRKKSC